MKTLLLSNQKGGVGKSAVVSQLAYYLADKRGLRTLVIDLDQQANTSKAVRMSGLATVAPVGASVFLQDKSTPLPSGNFVLIPGDDGLVKLEKQGTLHNAIAGNFRDLIQRASENFDVCILDTNPMPDIRMTAALVSADFVLSPIQMNQEAIDGISSLMRDVKAVQARLNGKLRMIGLLPNLVTPTPFQKANFAELAKHYGHYLIKMDGNRFAHLKERTAVAEAQAAGQPIYKSNKTSAREAWREWEDVFTHVAKTMEVA